MTEPPLRTPWIETVARGAQPDAAALRDHLRTVHREHPGFTEACAGQCRDAEGRTSYEWLAEAVERDRHRSVLDLACGSGALLSILDARMPPRARLIGVDMSPDELALARARLPSGRAELIEGRAQEIALADGSVDAVLCHWALTLMDPVAPVLAEVARVCAPGGRFAALVDGPFGAAPGYAAAHDLIYGHVQAALPAYGRIELGDPRIRDTDDLLALAGAAFPAAAMRVETAIVRLRGPADVVAREAAGFFYAAFALAADARAAMLDDLATLLSKTEGTDAAAFAMPVNRLVVDLPGIRPTA
jgi:SAM-dependent methyltransferase